MADLTVNVDASALRLPAQTGQGGKFLTTDGTNPSWATAAGTGDVTGPASSTDGNIVLMNGATGKVIKDSGLNISEIIEEDPGAGVGLIESGAGVSPIVLKNLKGGQGTQSVSNTGSVQVDIHFTAANKYHYSDASGDPLEGDITAAGRNLLDDADASAQRSTIGLSNVPNVDTTNPANITQDTTHRFTTDTEKATWNALIGGSVFQTTWNATTNSPSLVSSTGTSGHYYIVNVAGSTNLDGITDWKVGDWAVFDGSVWRKVDNTDAVSSVNSLTGAVVLDTSNVSDTSNKRYVTDAQLVVIGNTSGTNTGDQTNISGNAATVTTNANLTGPVTSVGNATAIADAALSIAKTSGLQTALDARLTGTAGTDIAYSGTPTYTAGAAPSGATNHHQFYTQVGNLVTWQIMLTHATTGTTVTGITATLPAEFPTPLIPTGFTGANAFLYACMPVRFISTPTGSMTLATNCNLKRNAANNGFEIVATIASGSYRTVILSGSYFTA